jgi:hypothetical protein
LTILLLVVLAHSFYDQACCSDRDCHPAPCPEVMKNLGSVMQMPSKDGQCHICQQGVNVRCIYIPQEMS